MSNESIFGVIKGNNVVNIVSANVEDANILPLLISDADAIVLSDEVTGVPFIGGDYFNGVFRPPSPYPSWIWVDGNWKAPIPYPTDDNLYFWDEDFQTWNLVESVIEGL